MSTYQEYSRKTEMYKQEGDQIKKIIRKESVVDFIWAPRHHKQASYEAKETHTNPETLSGQSLITGHSCCSCPRYVQYNRSARQKTSQNSNSHANRVERFTFYCYSSVNILYQDTVRIYKCTVKEGLRFIFISVNNDDFLIFCSIIFLLDFRSQE